MLKRNGRGEFAAKREKVPLMAFIDACFKTHLAPTGSHSTGHHPFS